MLGERWYVYDATIGEHRPIWYAEVRHNVGPVAYETIALCRRLQSQREDAELIAQAPALRAVNAALVAALQAVEAHHVHLNEKHGRAEGRSRTLGIVRAALKLAREAPS